jgi:hypothetical protein
MQKLADGESAMVTSRVAQIEKLKQLIADLEARQHSTGVDLSDEIAGLRDMLTGAQAKAAPPSTTISGVEMQADTSNVGGDVVGRDKVKSRRGDVSARQYIEKQINMPASSPVTPAADREEPQSGTVFDNVESDRFSPFFVKQLREARHIAMVGIGFSILRKDYIQRIFFSRMESGCEIEICAANPYSPNVEMRLVEEETGAPMPTIGKQNLEKWLRDMLAKKAELGKRANLSLQLFPFYPTYALFIFDKREYFLYPYGYAQLGTLSPVFYYSRDNQNHKPMVDFLQSQYDLIKARSTDAALILEREDLEPGPLTAFAVYIVPPQASDLYKFGSQILRYDVRKREIPDVAKWYHPPTKLSRLLKDAIGAANDFGFHLTVADALYCANREDLRLICEEVKFVAEDIRHFAIRLKIEKDFPNSRGIALVCEDPSGTLEALHHEMVARVYRKAIASNYSIGLAAPDRDQDQERARLMISRYHAPYILQRFNPHFSLLSNVPETDKEEIYQYLKDLFKKNVRESLIKIDKIAVMHRPLPNKCWEILREYHLGGKS